MSGHRRSQSAASDLTIVDTYKISGSACPSCFVDDQYLDVPCRSKSECGPTNCQAVICRIMRFNFQCIFRQRTDQCFTEYCSTNVQPVHSSHTGRDHSVAGGGPTTLRRSILLRFFSKIVRWLQENKPLE